MGAVPRALRRFGMGRSGGGLVRTANESGDAPEYRLSPQSTKYGLRRWVRDPALFAALGWDFGLGLGADRNVKGRILQR